MKEKNLNIDRRGALRALSALGVLGAGIGVCDAQRPTRGGTQKPTRDLAAIRKLEPSILELKLSDPRALRALNLQKRLPERTSIAKMGLTKAAQSSLTPNARKLTKADLVSLGKGELTKTSRMLTVKDIVSIQEAFGKGYVPGIDEFADVACCCCTPCCCAAAMEPQRAA